MRAQTHTLMHLQPLDGHRELHQCGRPRARAAQVELRQVQQQRHTPQRRQRRPAGWALRVLVV